VGEPIRAIVFDFDGVILESAEVKTEAFVELYADYGPAIVDGVRAHHLANLGISRFKKFSWIAENLLRQPIGEAELAALGKRFSELALARVLSSPFVDGAEEALIELAPRYKLFVASGTPHDELALIVERRGLTSRFLEVHGTPAEKPAIVYDIMARHHLHADEIVFVGDGTSDYDAAITCGVNFLARDTPPLHDEWVRRGVRREPDLRHLAEVVASW